MSKEQKTIEELMEEALVSEEEQTYEVPENWLASKFNSILKINSGKSLTRKQMNEEGSIPVFGGNGLTGSHDQFNVDKETIVIGRVGFYCGSVHLTPKKAWVTDNAFIVNFSEHLFDKKYLYWNLKQLNLGKYSNSSAQPVISGKTLTPVIINIPPVNEQKRIAEKVERLLGKIEESKRLIEEAKEMFELRRAAILDKAFRGELTSKLRKENANITTADEWIEQIYLLKAGTRTKYKDQLDSSILDKLYELPKEWKWVRLNDLIEASTYGTSAKTNDDVTGTPVLRMGNIVDGCLELNDLKYLPNDHEDVLKYVLQTNDLLFNRTNSYELVGKTSVITEEVSQRFTFASYLIRVRLFYKDILASYVSHYINSQIGRKILLSMVTQQVGQANINSQKLASLPIPLPSQEEVIEITKWLNNYRELESKQKEMIQVEENVEALKQ